jgi:hypothetical protein
MLCSCRGSRAAFVAGLLTALLLTGGPTNAEERCGALWGATITGDTGVMMELLDHGVDVNCLHRGETALIAAARTGVVEAVGILLGHGADMNVTDEEGRTALVHARKLLAESDDPTQRACAQSVIDALEEAGPAGHAC